MKRVGLYFGTFNPIHIGHLIIANHIVELSDLDEVWFVITPCSPFKTKKTLLSNTHRYNMVFDATASYERLKPCTIEFDMPQPNYTIDTLVRLEEKHGSEFEFVLLMGEDNLKNFHKWKNYEVILENYSLYVYPRISEGEIVNKFLENPKINKINAPIIEISSTLIRKLIKDGKNTRPLLPIKVWEYIDNGNLFK